MNFGKKLVLAGLLMAAMFCSVSAMAEETRVSRPIWDQMTEKLGRGIANIAFGPLELLIKPYDVANDDGARLFMEAVNLSCDPVESFEFEVAPPYAGGKVEVLDGASWRDAGARWNGVRFTVKPRAAAHVYGTLVLRIAK